ncbi:MAG: C40 family peptidase [Nocardioides sp.]|uniref:C40 family peptidase n=1 Tax=Nocardioides sp. TaxID=35761 RepID=UPI0039E617B1
MSLVVLLGLTVGLAQASAAGETEPSAPSQAEVDAAQGAATGKAAEVARVQAELAVANDDLRRSSIAAAQATEAFNGARWRLQTARAAVRRAERQLRVAEADLAERRSVIADGLATGYQSGPSLRTFSTLLGEKGIDATIHDAATYSNAESAMSDQYDAYEAASTLATVASDLADRARSDAATAADEAKAARDQARQAEQTALAQAQQIGHRKEHLLGELATLQGISVDLAEQRQSALEQQAAENAQQTAENQGDNSGDTDPEPSDPGPSDPGPSDPGPSDPSPSDPGPSDPAEPSSPSSSSPPSTPTPSDPPATTPPSTPPPPASGASAAIAFAKAQLGEPYRWGAAGPDAWDCSGLTMMSWRAGGKSLPHYSVAQYQQSTAIKSSQLRPGDLVFWGSSSSSSSIYHVALYIGDGQIIHAPRTGRPVSQESMYYWIAPNFFARP